MRAGWRKGRSRERASCATGVGCARRPLPFLVSGWETTRPTSWSEEMRPRRTVAAKSGVPAKAIFKGWRGLALGDKALAHLAHGDLAGFAVGAVQDQDAVEVVDLVLEDPRENARGLQPQGRSRDEDALEATYLVGGEPHTLELAHGGQHLIGEVRQRVVEALDRRGTCLEHRVSESPYI